MTLSLTGFSILHSRMQLALQRGQRKEAVVDRYTACKQRRLARSGELCMKEAQ